MNPEKTILENPHGTKKPEPKGCSLKTQQKIG